MAFPYSARTKKIFELLKHPGTSTETRRESPNIRSSNQKMSAEMGIETNSRHIEIEMIQVEYADTSCEQNTGLEYTEIDPACEEELLEVICMETNGEPDLQEVTAGTSADDILIEPVVETNLQEVTAGTSAEIDPACEEELLEVICMETNGEPDLQEVTAGTSADDILIEPVVETNLQEVTAGTSAEIDPACEEELLEVICMETNGEPDLQEVTAGTSADDILIEPVVEANLQEVTAGTSTEEIAAGTSESKSQKRRRHADPDTWQKNIRKVNRCTGKAYTSAKGVQVPARKPKLFCDCKLKCYTLFSQEEIDMLHKQYYQLGNAQLQKSMLSNLIEEKNVERNRFRGEVPLKPKSCSRFYNLPKENKKVRVCVNFFIGTFSVSYSVVRLLMKNKVNLTYVGSDGRKGRPAPNATPAEAVEAIKTHIDSFPRVESHYCRKDSKKLYLSADLNLSIMYRLYKDEYCPNNGITPVTNSIYRKIFNEYDPPLTFYIPKKDQCSVCNVYNRATDKTALEEEYKHHKRREAESMEMKKQDKIRSVEDEGKTYRSISFDMQAILSIPHSGDSQIYYKRKLSMYNFTIFDCYNADGLCYIWDETQGGKGSSEVGTCLLKYLSGLPKEVLHVSCFSDTCGGQNRNQHIAAAMLFAVNNYTCETIDIKFMESGHSYLEADSIHSTIERKKKHSNVYSLNEWSLLIGLSRIKPRPYKVTTLKHGDIFDLQELSKSMFNNVKIDSHEENVSWLKIKWLRFEKKSPNSILFKYNLSDDDFRVIDVLKKSRRSGRNRSWNLSLPYKYLNPLPISHQKKADLKYLLDRGIIPSEYKEYIEGLPSLSS